MPWRLHSHAQGLPALESGPKVRNVSDALEVRTLLAYLPAESLGLRTSVPGRLLFLFVIDFFALALMRSHPLSIIPQGAVLISALALMWLFGAARFLRARASFMLACTCVSIGAINFAFPELKSIRGASSALPYGLTRTLAFGGMAYSTLLIAAITRPGDIARFGLRCRLPWYPFLFAAIPLSSIDAVASRYHDILLIVRARYARTRFALRARVVDAAAALFSTTLRLALHHHQVGVTWRPLPWAPQAASAQMSPAPIVASHDLLFLCALIPPVASALFL